MGPSDLDDDELDRALPLTPKRAAALKQNQPVIAERLTWFAVHGAICLALRHPDFKGPTRDTMLQFVRELGQGLVGWGCLTADELAMIEKTENLVQ